MLKREDRPLFAALLFIALALVLCWAVPSPSSKEDDAAQKCATHECREDAAAEALAEYTKILAIFTALLAIVSAAQWAFLWRADKTARISADAAKKSADTAAAINLARLVLFRLDFDEMGGANLWARLQYPKVKVVLQNYGRSPAFVQSQAIEFCCGDLPAKPNYNRTVEYLPPETVTDSGAIHILQGRPGELYSEAQIKSITEMNRLLWVFGYVSYKDILGAPHMLRFCKLLWPSTTGGTTVFNWVESNPPASYVESF